MVLFTFAFNKRFVYLSTNSVYLFLIRKPTAKGKDVFRAWLHKTANNCKIN